MECVRHITGKSWSVFRRKWIKISHVECWKVESKHGQSKEHALACDTWHEVYRRLLWLNMLWTVQGLDSEGIRAWLCWSLKSLSKWAVVLQMQTAGTSLVWLERVQAQSPRQICPRFPGWFCASLSFSHRAGLASLKGDSAALPAA